MPKPLERNRRAKRYLLRVPLISLITGVVFGAMAEILPNYGYSDEKLMVICAITLICICAIACIFAYSKMTRKQVLNSALLVCFYTLLLVLISTIWLNDLQRPFSNIMNVFMCPYIVFSFLLTPLVQDMGLAGLFIIMSLTVLLPLLWPLFARCTAEDMY